jgi:dTDP-4-amino-4,6-dideoxy-D-glucose/dTDP-4-amino-2,4-dideoxy-beta-L-xylose transaminase
MAPSVVEHVAKVLTPDEQGRVYSGEGPRVAEFEREFAVFVNARHRVLAMNSCTSALEMALYLCGVGPDTDVITTPMTCTATNGAIVRLGGRPVWADIDPVTGLIDPSDVARKLTRKTRAVMAVDWAGRSCDYQALRRAAKQAPWLEIPVIQDAAHNLLVDMDNCGDYVCWSFQHIKHLTTGDGGALMTPEAAYDRARLLRWYGLDRESRADFRCAQDITEVGWKAHMNDIAAAIGLANLAHAGRVVAQQRANARWYASALRGIPGIVLPPADERSSWWLYTLLLEDRDEFIAYMNTHEVMCSPVHARNDRHTAFTYPNGDLPGVDAFAAREVAIPVGWWLSEQDKAHVALSVRKFASRGAAVAA